MSLYLWLIVAICLICLILISKSAISRSQAKSRLARFKLDQRRRAGIPDSDHRPFSIAVAEVKDRKAIKFKEIHSTASTSTSVQTPSSRRFTATSHLSSLPTPSRHSSYAPSPSSNHTQKPFYAQLTLSNNDQQARRTQEELKLALRNQAAKQRDPYNPSLQNIPFLVDSAIAAKGKSNKRSHDSDRGGGGGSQVGDLSGEGAMRGSRSNKARRVHEEQQDEQDDSMEWDDGSEEIQAQYRDGQYQEEDDLMEVDDDDDRPQRYSRGKKREIDDLSTTMDQEDEGESVGSRSSLVGDDELLELPVRRGGNRKIQKKQPLNSSPRKKQKGSDKLSSQMLDQDPFEEEEEDLLEDEEMKSVSTLQTKPSVSRVGGKKPTLSSPSKRKLSTSNDREPGEEWQDLEGMRWKMGNDGIIRRLAVVRTNRNKYPNMPKDSTHPDKDLMEIVYVGKFVTGDEYEELRKKKELVGQQEEREELIRKKEESEREERGRRVKEEEGRREGRRVKALGGRSSLGSQSLFNAPSNGTPLRSGTPSNLARSLIPASGSRGRSSIGASSPPGGSSKRLSLGARSSSPAPAALGMSTSSSQIQAPGTPTSNSRGSLARSGSLLLGVRRTSLNAEDKKRREEELRNRLRAEKEEREAPNKVDKGKGKEIPSFSAPAAPLFGASSTSSEAPQTSAPSFNLGGSQPQASTSTVNGFNLFSGAPISKPEETKEKPKDATPSFSFGNPPQEKKEESKAQDGGFNFKQPNASNQKSPKAPTFFGNTSSSASTTQTPASQPPSFSFAPPTQSTTNPAPETSASKPRIPSFSFAPPTPTLNQSSTPASQSQPPFNLSAPAAPSSQPTATSTPAFSFGAPAQALKPASSTPAAPTFNFGATSSSTPAASPAPAAAAVPAFNFKFGSGSAQPEAPKTELPKFSFGAGSTTGGSGSGSGGFTFGGK